MKIRKTKNHLRIDPFGDMRFFIEAHRINRVHSIKTAAMPNISVKGVESLIETLRMAQSLVSSDPSLREDETSLTRSVTGTREDVQSV